MTKKIYFIFYFIVLNFILSLSLCSNLFARTFSLEEAIEISQQKNPDLKILQFELKQLKNNIAQNRTEIMPKINFVADDTNKSSFESNLTYKDSKFVSQLVPVEKYQYDLKFVGDQKIMDLAYMSKIGSLKRKYDSEFAGYLQKKQDVAFDVVNAYYNLMKSEHTKQIIEQDVVILENYLQDMKNKLNLNFETKQAVLNMEITLNNKKQDLYKNNQIYYENRTEFAGLLEFPLSLDFEVSDFQGLLNIEPMAVSTATVKNTLDKTLVARYDIAKLLYTKESLVKEKRSIKKGFLPSFSVQGIYGYLNENEFSNTEKDKYWSVSFVGKLNIFNGFYEYLKIKELSLQIEKNDQQIQNFVKKLEIEIDKVLFYIEVQEKMYSEAQQNMAIAEENLRINKELFNQKQISKDEFIGAQLKYNSAKLQYVESKSDLLLSYKKYEYITGELKV
jgi:outer membrane protein